MQHIIDFLSSPTWQGIQGLLAVVALLLTLSKPRKWLENRRLTKWASKVPWVFLFVTGGIAAGLSLGIKYQDMYRGTIVALTAISMGLAIQFLQSQRAANLAKAQLQERTTSYNRLFKILHRIVNIHRGSPADFKADDRKMIYSITNEKGDDLLREELTILPVSDPVYFLFKRYAVGAGADQQPALIVSAESLPNGTPLSVLELERSEKNVQCVVLVDPPSTRERPQRIAIICKRSGIWPDLVQNREDEGSFRLSFQTNSVQAEFIAPPGRKWKAFVPVPNIGTIQINESFDASRIIWRIENPPVRVYNYKVFLE